MRKIGLLAVLIVLMATTATFANAEGATVEEVLSEKAQRTLDRVFGNGAFVAIVSVEMTAPNYEVRYTRQSKTSTTAQSGSGDKMQILPGYPVIRNLAPDNFKQLPFDSVTRYMPSTLRRIKLTLIANQSFPKNKLPAVQRLVEQVLGMVPNRDATTVIFQAFSHDIKESPQKSLFQMQPANASKEGGARSDTFLQWLGVGALGLILVIFMVIYFYIQMRYQKWMAGFAKQHLQALQSQNNSTASPISAGRDSLSTTGAVTGEMNMASENRIRKYFDFVDDSNIDKLLFILDREKIGMENLALLIPCIKPHLATKILATLDSKTQAIVSVNIVNPKMFNKDLIEKFETQLKNAMECLIGGKAVSSLILGAMSGQAKKELLSVLKGNEEGYRRVRPYLIFFDDLDVLDDADIQLIINSIARDTLATSLISVAPQLYQKFDQNMSKNQKALIQEFIELRSRLMSENDVEAAQEVVVKRALELDTQGRIQWRSKI